MGVLLGLKKDQESKAIKKFLEYPYFGTYKKQHLYSLHRFLNWSECNSFDEFLVLPIKAQSNLVQSFINDLSEIIKNSGLENYINAFSIFYEQNEYNFEPLDVILPDEKRILGIPYTNLELKRMFNLIVTTKNKRHEPMRNHAWFMLLTSSGIHLADILQLQIQDLIPIKQSYAIEVYSRILSFHGGYRSSGPWQTTFTTPEARIYLDNYLKTRKDLTPESFVFPQTINSMYILLSRLTNQAGISRIVFGGKQRMKNDQGVRKSFYNILESNGLDR